MFLVCRDRSAIRPCLWTKSAWARAWRASLLLSPAWQRRRSFGLSNQSSMNTPHGRLMLTVLGGLAEFERDLIRSRTSEGRARAQARGVKLGRRPKLSTAQQSFVAKARAQGESVRHLARVLGVSKATSAGSRRRSREAQFRFRSPLALLS